MAEDRGRISAEEMLNRLLKQEGVSMEAKPDSHGVLEVPQMTEFDLAMTAFKVAHVAISILLDRKFVTPQELAAYIAFANEAMDNLFEVVEDGEEEDE